MTIYEELQKMINSYKYETNGLEVSFNYKGYDGSYIFNKDTNYYLLSVDVIIKRKLDGEKTIFNMDLLKVPIETDVGYKLKGSYTQVLDTYTKAHGWYLTQKKDDQEDKTFKALEFIPTRNKPLTFFVNHGVIYVSTSKNKNKVKLGTFLKAISGKSNNELIELLGPSRYVISSLTNDTVQTAADEVYENLVKVKCDIPQASFRSQAVRTRFLSPRYMGTDEAGKIRLSYNTSFLRRALNFKLTESLSLGKVTYKEGTLLTTDILTEIDKSGIESLTCSNGKNSYVMKKYKVSKDGICLEEYLTMINMYTHYLEGLEHLRDNEDELDNKVLLTFERNVIDKARANLDAITARVDDEYTMDLAELVNLIEPCDTDKLIASLKDIGNTNNQTSDLVNILSYKAKNDKVSPSYQGHASVDMIKIQDLQRGRLDPIDCPESTKAGRVHYKTIMTKPNSAGFLLAPYLNVENGVVTSLEPVYLSSSEEHQAYIAEWNEDFSGDKIKVFYNGSLMYVPKSQVNYKQFSPIQDCSYIRSTCPFQGHDNVKRINMYDNQARQAICLTNPDRPLVSTGCDSMIDVGYYTAKQILDSFYDAHDKVLHESREQFCSRKISIQRTLIEKDTRKFIFSVEGLSVNPTKSVPFFRKTGVETIFSYRVNYKESYQGDDIVLYNNSLVVGDYDIKQCTDWGAQKVDDSIYNKCVSLGKNFVVGYKTSGWTTQDDAITIRKGLCYDGSVDSVTLIQIDSEAMVNEDSEERFGLADNVSDINVNSQGLPAIGTYVNGGSMVIGKYVIKYSTDIKTGQRCVKGTNDRSVYLSNNLSGRVVFAKIVENKAIVLISTHSTGEKGDKFTGRHGNKGVVARVVEDAEMPYIESTGEPLDVCLNPLGIPSRMNIGQVLEAALGMCAYKNPGRVYVVSPFHPNDAKFVKQECEANNVRYEWVVDAKTGQRFKRPINVGVLHMLKLEHQAYKKVKSVAIPKSVSPTMFQSQKGRNKEGGQKFGEMETWALMAAGAYNVLDEIISTSDDIVGQSVLEHYIESNPYDVEPDCTSHNDYILQIPLRLFGIDLCNSEKGDYRFYPLKDSVVKAFSHMPVNTVEMLRDPTLFQYSLNKKTKSASRAVWSWVNLGCEIVNPFWIRSSVNNLIITKQLEESGLVTMPAKAKDLGRIIDGELLVEYGTTNIYTEKQARHENGKRFETGVSGVVSLLKNTTIDKAIEYYNDFLKSSNNANKTKELKWLSSAKLWKQRGLELTDLIITTYPVMPLVYRPQLSGLKSKNRKNDFDNFYIKLLSRVSMHKNDKSEKSRQLIYKEILLFEGIDRKANKSNSGGSDKAKFTTVMNYFCKKDNSDKAVFREYMLAKRTIMSGRSVITPCEEPMLITQIGIPFLSCVTTYRPYLVSLLNREGTPLEDYRNKLKTDVINKLLDCLVSKNYTKFDRILGNRNDPYLFDKVQKFVVDFLETRVVLHGRQPTLHQYSIHAYRIKVVYGRSIEIHPLVCGALNADFDGDTTWWKALIGDVACEEAMRLLSAEEGIINPKDSSIMIEHTQDMLLGLYFATMLKDNATTIDSEYYKNTGIYSVTSLDELETCVDTNSIQPWDLCSIKIDGRYYLSTAGRILFNAQLCGLGFTDKPFTNTLDIPGIKNERFCELGYDGLVAKKGSKVKVGTRTQVDENGNEVEIPVMFRYCRLGEILKNSGRNLDIYQNLTVFGFKMADMSGITIGLDDIQVETPMEKFNAQALELGNKINQAYINGLISDSSRKRQLVAFYKRYANTVKANTLSWLSRNNNLFIMQDSGARGNESQINQTLGVIGISMKTLTESLETPILRNYVQGLGAYDLFCASYAGRMGVSSTQNSVTEAGYATRRSIYVVNGLKVVEEDCGIKDITTPVEYSDAYKMHKDGVDLVGETDPLSIRGLLVELHIDLKDNPKLENILKYFLPSDGKLTTDCARLILKNHIHDINCKEGKYRIFYKIDSGFRDLLYRKVGVDLPFLNQFGCITPKTINYIEDQNLEFIQVRTMFKCESVNGVCSKCAGLKIEKDEFPEVDEYIGYTSAHCLGEPVTQCTLSLTNQGGVGSSVSNGVEIYSSLLSSGKFPVNEEKSIIAESSGYVTVEDFGKKSIIRLGNQILKKPSNLVSVVNNEYVERGMPLTIGFTDTNTLPVPCQTIEDLKEMHYMRQIHLMNCYFNTFKANDVKVHARHIEALVRLQLGLTVVTECTDPDVLLGHKYEFTEMLRRVREEPGFNFYGRIDVAKQEEVMQYYGGPLSRIAFEDQRQAMCDIVVEQYSSDLISPIDRLFIGEDLKKNKRKKLVRPSQEVIQTIKNIEKVVEEPVEVVYDLFEEEEIAIDETSSLDDLLNNLDDFGDLDDEENTDILDSESYNTLEDEASNGGNENEFDNSVENLNAF